MTAIASVGSGASFAADPKPPVTQVLLVRHGRPVRVDDAAGADPQLTVFGREQAEALGRWMARRDDAQDLVVYSSPMRRALETARPLVDQCGVELRVDERLVEFDHGATSYIPIEQLDRQSYAEALSSLATGAWGDHRFDPDAFEARVGEAIDDAIARHRGSTVVVVCHGGVINSYLGGVLERPRGFFFQPRYTSISRVAVSGNPQRRFLLSLNEVPHLAH